MNIEQILTWATFLFILKQVQPLKNYTSDVGLNAKELMINHGYPYQSYTVKTDDGYLLKLQRIPHGRLNNTIGNRHPVLLMPGLFCDSAVFVNMGPNSLAFILADNGYDVWLGNNRGSTLSRKHVSLNPDVDVKFWDYTFHEVGYYDAPAFIDRILKVTKRENLYYIGHSQGGTCYFVMLSEKPHYASKIRYGALLAPASVLVHSSSPAMTIFVESQNLFKNYAYENEAYEIVPHSKELLFLGATMCKEGSPFLDTCGDILLYVAGWTPKQLNKARIAVITSNTPAGASIKQVFHYFQLISGIFQNYDYGITGNLKRYGQESPPKYNLTKVTPSTGIYHGDGDWMTAPKDIQFTVENLPNVFVKRMYKDFNHLDMIWGIDASAKVFNDILNDFILHN